MCAVPTSGDPELGIEVARSEILHSLILGSGTSVRVSSGKVRLGARLWRS